MRKKVYVNEWKEKFVNDLSNLIETFEKDSNMLVGTILVDHDQNPGSIKPNSECVLNVRIKCLTP